LGSQLFHSQDDELVLPVGAAVGPSDEPLDSAKAAEHREQVLMRSQAEEPARFGAIELADEFAS
jgi:hypothetical protein